MKLLKIAFLAILMTGASCAQTIEESAQKLHTNANALESVVNGPATGAESDVALPGGGTQITLSKAIAQILSQDRDSLVFANEAARNIAIPNMIGQSGYQVDTATLYRAFGTSAGQWNVDTIYTRLNSVETTVSGLSLAEAAGVYSIRPSIDNSWKAASIATETTEYMTASGATNSIVPNAIIRMLKGDDISLPGGQLAANYFDDLFSGWLLGSTTNAPTGTVIYDIDSTNTPKPLDIVGSPTRDVLGMRFGSGKYLQRPGAVHLWSGAVEYAKLIVYTADTPSSATQQLSGQYPPSGAPNGRTYEGILSDGRTTAFHGNTAGNISGTTKNGNLSKYINTILVIQGATEYAVYQNGNATPIVSGSRTPQVQSSIAYRIGANSGGGFNCVSQIHGVFLFNAGDSGSMGADYAAIHENLTNIFQSLTPTSIIHPTGKKPIAIEVDNTSGTSNLYLGSPDIFRLPNGKLCLRADEFGSGAPTDPDSSDISPDYHTSRVYTSVDEGKTWVYQNSLTGLFWATVVHQDGNDIYLLGTNRRYGDIVIAKSSDNMATITTTVIQAGPLMHRGPSRAVIKNGILSATVERNKSTSYPIEEVAIASVDISTDLMNSANWTISAFYDSDSFSDPSFFTGSTWAWSEFNVVEMPDGKLAALGRFDTNSSSDEYNYLVKLNLNSAGTAFEGNPEFIALSGGYTKFEILPLPSGGFLFVHNRDTNIGVTTDDRTALALSYTPNLTDFTQLPDIYTFNQNSTGSLGVQYPRGMIDGNDLLLGLRVGLSAGTYHDSPDFHFMKVENFGEYIRAGMTKN